MHYTQSHYGFRFKAPLSIQGQPIAPEILQAAARVAQNAQPGKRAYARLPLSDGGEAFVKVYTRAKNHSILTRLGTSRAAREAASYRAIVSAGHLVPALLAYGERRKARFCDCSIIITRVVPGPTAADRFIVDPTDLTDVITAATALAALHTSAVAHGDPGVSNLILSSSGPVWLDPGKHTALTPGSRLADLAQFLGSIMSIGASQTQCQQILDA